MESSHWTKQINCGLVLSLYVRISKISSLANYFVIVTANSSAQINAISDNIEKIFMEKLMVPGVRQDTDYLLARMIMKSRRARSRIHADRSSDIIHSGVSGCIRPLIRADR